MREIAEGVASRPSENALQVTALPVTELPGLLPDEAEMDYNSM
jgi:hypothetical protein